MASKQQSEAFNRVAADPGQQWHEDGCAAVIPWERVSAPNRVNYLASYAAAYDVPFGRFEQAVRNALGRQSVIAAEQSTLRGKFEAARLLLAPVEPLESRFEKILSRQPDREAKATGKVRSKGIER